MEGRERKLHSTWLEWAGDGDHDGTPELYMCTVKRSGIIRSIHQSADWMTGTLDLNANERQWQPVQQPDHEPHCASGSGASP